MQIDIRSALIGSDPTHSLKGITVAAGVYVAVLVTSFVPISVGAVLVPGLVITGVALASWWAYQNSGIAVSVALTVAPVLARLTYYSWLYAGQGRGIPVALPLSFGGSGAWKLWVPLALLLGVVAFGIGVLLRWGRRFVGNRNRVVG